MSKNMNDDLTKGWSKDFETGLPLVPHGRFTDFAPYAKVSTQPARVRKLPVLCGSFQSEKFDFTPGLPAHAGWGTVELSNAFAMTFRIQVGPNVLYWFANLCDPAVWKVLDEWAAARTMVLAADFENGKSFLVTRDFVMHPRFSEMRAAIARVKDLTPLFVASAARVVLMDEAKDMASSDLPKYPALQHVQACMLVTEHTGTAAMMVNRDGPGPGGPLATAVGDIAEAILKPGETRH
jgi:hypothetical protein